MAGVGRLIKPRRQTLQSGLTANVDQYDLTQLLPFIGYFRSLNAIKVITGGTSARSAAASSLSDLVG
jgi:hypothetical protein